MKKMIKLKRFKDILNEDATYIEKYKPRPAITNWDGI